MKSQGTASSDFPDHFSSRASNYARFRPAYPEALYRWLADLVPRHDRAWDCASGPGQAAEGLAPFFRSVIATDASIAQLASGRFLGPPVPVASLAECSPLRDHSVDLVTIAQALHWLRPEAFFEEVRRVARDEAVVSAWGYLLCGIEPDIDELVKVFYQEVVGPYWPPEREILSAGFRDIELPFPEVDAPGFELTARWNRERFLSYVETWSATNRYLAKQGANPVRILRSWLEPFWPPQEERLISWPMILRIGRIRH